MLFKNDLGKCCGMEMACNFTPCAINRLGSQCCMQKCGIASADARAVFLRKKDKKVIMSENFVC